MTKVNGHGLSGPYRSEQEFKTEWIKHALERSMPGTTYHCIETEETEPGFPDVMKLTYDRHAFFYEMKIADKDDNFTLQRTQPLFYRNHTNYFVVILVWSNKRNALFAIKADELLLKIMDAHRLTLNLKDFKEE